MPQVLVETRQLDCSKPRTKETIIIIIMIIIIIIIIIVIMIIIIIIIIIIDISFGKEFKGALARQNLLDLAFLLLTLLS